MKKKINSAKKKASSARVSGADKKHQVPSVKVKKLFGMGNRSCEKDSRKSGAAGFSTGINCMLAPLAGYSVRKIAEYICTKITSGGIGDYADLHVLRNMMLALMSIEYKLFYRVLKKKLHFSTSRKMHNPGAWDDVCTERGFTKALLLEYVYPQMQRHTDDILAEYRTTLLNKPKTTNAHETNNNFGMNNVLIKNAFSKSADASDVEFYACSTKAASDAEFNAGATKAADSMLDEKVANIREWLSGDPTPKGSDVPYDMMQVTINLSEYSLTAICDVITGLNRYAQDIASDDNVAKCADYAPMKAMMSVADTLGIDAEGIRLYMLKCMINGASDYEEYIKPALEMYSYAHTGHKCATDITDSEFINAYGCIFGEYPKSVSSAINTLISTGLLCSDMCYDTKLLLMLSMGNAAGVLGLGYTMRDASDAIDLSAFENRISGIDLMMSILKNYDYSSRMHILLYGVPGSGKTAMIKSVARSLGLSIADVKQAGDAGDSGGAIHSDEERTQSVHPSVRIGYASRADRVMRSMHRNNVIVLIDEADTILQSSDKGYLNIFMDNAKTPVIWIANRIACEESTLRRFDYSIKFPAPGKTERACIWKSVLKKQGASDMFSERDIRDLAEKYNVTAGYMETAVRVTRRAAGKDSYMKTIRSVLDAQCELTGTEMNNENNPVPTGYDPGIIRIDGDTRMVESSVKGFAEVWKKMKRDDPPKSMNMLFYGPPGTGKTAYAAYIAKLIGRPIIVKACSDLVDCYVGNTEKNIRAAFAEAEQTGSVLFFDEADSFFSDRGGASHSWGITQVNELLMRMEHFKGIFIAATNFNDNFDGAANRRFAMKLKFDFLDRNGISRMWSIAFPSYGECPESVLKMTSLAPGDFSAVRKGVEFALPETVTADRLADSLMKEVAMKKCGNDRKMGF